MSNSFIPIFFIALVLIVFWRLTLVVATAALIAMIFIGMGFVADDVIEAEEQTSLLAPGVDQGSPPQAEPVR